MKKSRNVSIQILRVCACLMVFLTHFGQRVDFGGIPRSFADFGQYGVYLFFLISGFLAGKTFWENPSINTRRYYAKRIIATLPLYFLVILYYFITENILNIFFNVIPSDELGIGWFRYIFLLNGFLNSDTYFWSNLGITWTIPIFIFFYFLAPFTLRKINSVRSSVFVWFLVYVITGIGKHFYFCTIFGNLHILYLGVVLHACVKKGCPLISAVVFSCMTLCMIILNLKDNTYISIFSTIILVFVSINDLRLPGWLQKTIDVTDKYSYTIYLTHGVVFCSLLDRLNNYGVSKTIIAILAIAGTVLSTWIVGRYIEQPVQRWLCNKFFKQTPQSR